MCLTDSYFGFLQEREEQEQLEMELEEQSRLEFQRREREIEERQKLKKEEEHSEIKKKVARERLQQLRNTEVGAKAFANLNEEVGIDKFLCSYVCVTFNISY
jgi:translation initiation factor 3 subunit A